MVVLVLMMVAVNPDSVDGRFGRVVILAGPGAACSIVYCVYLPAQMVHVRPVCLVVGMTLCFDETLVWVWVALQCSHRLS